MSEERKMTAVQWLFEQLEFDESMSVDDIDKVINQAKQMEKEQMKEVAWHFREIDMKKINKGLVIDHEFNEYWNQTYGKP